MKLAGERRAVRGLPRLPDKVTPHTLRHTYISIALIATKGDTAWVQDQVGHADHETTSRIYRHVIRRRQGHGPAFDRLVAQPDTGVAQTVDAGLNVDRLWTDRRDSANAPRPICLTHKEKGLFCRPFVTRPA